MDPNSVSRVNWAINRRAEGLVSKHMADMAQRRSAVSEENTHPLPGDLSRSAEDIPGRAEVNFSADSQSYNPAGVAGKLMREDSSSTSETMTYTCHYMTDRLERFDLKTSKLDLLKKKRHLHLGCPWETAAHRQIISLLIEIKEEQQRQWEVLKDLQARIHGQVCEEEDEPLDVDLPLRTMEQLDETEQHLEDTEAQKKMVSHLSRMGGATVDDAVRRLMHAVLSFSVGSELNWVGRGQKRSFRNTRLQGVLFRALKRTPVGKEATHHQFADVVKKWLRFAPFRQRGSGRRPHWKPIEFICPKYDSTVEDHNQLNHNQLDSGEIQVTI